MVAEKILKNRYSIGKKKKEQAFGQKMKKIDYIISIKAMLSPSPEWTRRGLSHSP